MKLRYPLPAIANFDSILTYIAEPSPQGAARVQKRIHDVIGLLLVHPEVGSEEIIIHAVRHRARDPGGMPGTRGSS